jgi:hypothetical protein
MGRIMGAGEDYLSVNAFNCLDPEGVSTKILSSPPVFLVPVYRFAVLGNFALAWNP